MKFESGSFIHVVGSIDLDSGKGEIHYVNRSKNRPALKEAKRNADVLLVGRDAEQRDLFKVPPVLRMAQCDPGEKGRPALIQEDLDYHPKLKTIALVYKGNEVHRFTGGGARSGGALAAGMTFSLSTPDASKPHRRTVEAAGMDQGEGVSYTVQVKPEGESVWHTIAVGSRSPQVEVDANQFAGVRKATLRVIRSTGFDEEIVAEKPVDLL
jgi:hypothetical protein